jgi:hypothetical protein
LFFSFFSFKLDIKKYYKTNRPVLVSCCVSAKCRQHKNTLLLDFCTLILRKQQVLLIENFPIFAFPQPMFVVQIGAGEIPDDTMLTCARGSDRFASLEFRFLCSQLLNCYQLGTISMLLNFKWIRLSKYTS